MCHVGGIAKRRFYLLGCFGFGLWVIFPFDPERIKISILAAENKASMFGWKKRVPQKDQGDPKENFWNWFIKNEHRFKSVAKSNSKASAFMDDLVSQIKPYNQWIKALAGPYDDKRYELIMTSDGDIALFCKVEELVKAAPPIDGWLITAHKPAIGMGNMRIDMHGHQFSSDNMSFYPLQDNNYPDEISIILVHKDYTEEENDNFQSGGMIFLENALGELNTATKIDKYEVRGTPAPQEGIELIPLTKLEDYLVWREKEFVEKYANKEATLPEENWGVLEAQDKNGKPMFTTLNIGFKNWEYRSAYPWLVQIDIDFKGNDKGLPDKKQMEEMQLIEDAILQKVLEITPALFIGHYTHDNRRSIYFHSHDYNTISKVIHHYLDNTVHNYDVVFFIRKDKYWQNMAFFYDAVG